MHALLHVLVAIFMWNFLLRMFLSEMFYHLGKCPRAVDTTAKRTLLTWIH